MPVPDPLVTRGRPLGFLLLSRLAPFHPFLEFFCLPIGFLWDKIDCIFEGAVVSAKLRAT